MKILVASVLGALVLACASSHAALTATNPIIPGFNPDPSICRVGEDFYVVATTCEYFPGVPIYHSRDLVNWKIIGHALQTSDALNLDGVECSGGIYAPTIRHHEGTFYVITTLVGVKGRQAGNFIVTAKNPAGPWSTPVWIKDAPGIDPSLFFDHDGRVYYCGNGRPEVPLNDKHRFIWIQELDRATLQLKGPRAVLESAEYFASGRLGSVNNFEAPHLFRRGEFYYLILAHGGTGVNHAVSVWRSKSPLGPWEMNPANPILTHRNASDSPAGITCTGHVDLTDAPDGSWWAVLLAVRSEGRTSMMGREIFLAQVTWEDEWPVVNVDGQRGRVRFAVAAPAFAKTVPLPPDARSFRDDFADEKLGLDWTFIRTPRENWWSLTASPGSLRMKLRPADITELAQPSFVGVRVTSAHIQATTSVRFEPSTAQQAAGLVVLRARDAAFTIVLERGESGRVAAAYFGRERLGAISVAAEGAVQLRAKLRGAMLELWAQDASGEWREVARREVKPMLEANGGRFTGTFAGLYATSRGEAAENFADFEWFEMTPAK